MSLPSPKIPALHALALGAVCFLAIAPFFWRGSPSGHDFEFHMSSWMEVLSQWKVGIVYPRWAALAHWGYGEARFLFYPPASWALGAALGAVLPWKMVPGAYCWLALLLAGLSMYRLAREWLPGKDALFAAALYAVNPYHLVIVYWRSAFAELLAAALLPILLLRILRLTETGFRPTLYLGITLAASWLTNAPAAVMIHYSAAGLALLLAVLERSWRPLWRFAIAVGLGAGLASFYLVPTVFETRWVNIDQVLAPGLRPQDNFLFTKIPDAEHNQFNLLVSTVATTEIIVLLVAVGMAWRARSESRNRWLILTCWGGAATLVMISITNPLWQHLPKFRFVQLPWRWLLSLNAVLAVLLAMSTRRWTVRLLGAGVLLGAVMVAGYRIQPPWWDMAADIAEMSDAIADHTGYEGSDEYVPLGADSYELNKDQPTIVDSSGKSVAAERLIWKPDDKSVGVRVDTPGLLTLRLFNYPAWEVSVNGKRVSTGTTDVTGLMMIPVARGQNDIQVHFARTRDRTVGGLISLASLGLGLAAWTAAKKSRAGIPL